MKRFLFILTVLLFVISEPCFAQSRAYVAAGSEVQVIDTGTNQIVGSITLPAVGSIPTVIVPSPDGSLVFVNSPSVVDTGIFVINTTTNQIVKMLQTAAPATDLAISPDGRAVYVLCSASGIAIIDTLALQVIDTISIPDVSQFGIAVSPDSKLLYILDRDGGLVRHIDIIDVSTKSITATILLPSTTDALLQLTLSSDGRRGYVANLVDQTVSVIDMQNGRAIGNVSVPGNPGG